MPAEAAPLKVLFISSRFYDYFEVISDALTRNGCDVCGVPLRVTKQPLTARALGKIGLRRLVLRKELSVLHEALANARRDNDVVIVINGYNLTREDIAALREANPRARFIYYTWDALTKFPARRALMADFDRCLSFDPEDCRNNPELGFRPLFFSDKTMARLQHSPSVSDSKWSVTFIGTDRPGRYELLQRIKRNSAGARLKPFLYLQTSVLKMLRDKFRGVGICHNKALPYSEFMRRNEEAACALDILETTGQTGLTMRTIEMLAIGKHLYTTNPYIARHPHIAPESFTVLDPDSPAIGGEFPSVRQPDEFYDYYSVDGFVRDLLHQP
ncbi:MAG: hypothetical protein NC187_09035 [Candidatus Amulumruptor caecigallinarius]|nr:hypothetical protein [Candidatus Amulumruptor caecigallinarius]MCM1397612.1 hypothetical protein [Candidatus Amulumruptor caecigallinarius]MCM1454605.1 hypothetical protein [bacterium]